MSALTRYVRGLLNGGNGCARCHRSWEQSPSHVTMYTESKGCLPLCEACWADLTPQERLPFYRVLWDRWNHGGFWVQYADGSWHVWADPPEPWPVIEAAVLAESAA